LQFNSVGENEHTGVIYRLKRNKPALAGGFFLAFAGVCALFAYVFIPDNSRDANLQDIRLIALPPLSEVLFWEEELNKSDGLWWWMNGREAVPKRVAFTNYRLNTDSLFYLPYGAPDVPELWQGLALKQHPGTMVRRVFWLGTDVMGRDMLSRLMLGLRVSLSVGFIAVLISLLVGVGLGTLAGYYRGWPDQCVGWLINVIWSIPSLLLVIAFSLALGKGLWQLFLAVGLTMWVDVARVVRGQVMALREREFVVAARAMGFSDGRIMLRHLLPNLTGPVVIMAAGNFATAILVESGLSFLGLGVQPPVASLGMMIKEHYPYIIMDAAYMALVPGFVILLLVLAFNLFGNGLSDAFDSKIKIS
jgi:ABC-type dipeptide/oligopeptide/nickel transport system permease subunit